MSEPARRNALFVEPFPPTGAKYQVSPPLDDAHHPVWSPDGNDLVLHAGTGNSHNAFAGDAGAAFAFGTPTTLSRPFINTAGSADRPYDIAHDGKAFLCGTELTAGPDQGGTINIVVNGLPTFEPRWVVSREAQWCPIPHSLK